MRQNCLEVFSASPEKAKCVDVLICDSPLYIYFCQIWKITKNKQIIFFPEISFLSGLGYLHLLEIKVIELHINIFEILHKPCFGYSFQHILCDFLAQMDILRFSINRVSDLFSNMSFYNQDDRDPAPHEIRPPDNQPLDAQLSAANSLPLPHDVEPLDNIKLPVLANQDSCVEIPDLSKEPHDSVVCDTERLES